MRKISVRQAEILITQIGVIILNFKASRFRVSSHSRPHLKYSVFSAVAVITLAILVSNTSLPLPRVSAHSGDSFEAFTTTTPNMDGIIGDDEWRAADKITYTIPDGEATIFVMNDARSLYIAARVEDDSLDEVVNISLDIFTIDFDVRHDGLDFDEGEDTISIGARNRAGDGFVGPDGVIFNDGILDVDGFVGRDDEGFNHFEIVHSFNSGDANDLASECGSTIGARFVLFDDSASDAAEITALPPGLSAASSDQSNWVDITIACPPPPPPEININLIAIIVIIIAWVAYGGYLVRKRRRPGKRVEQDTT